MVHIVKMTDDEKISMYMEMDKIELAKMLVNCNNLMDKLIVSHPYQYIPIEDTLRPDPVQKENGQPSYGGTKQSRKIK